MSTDVLVLDNPLTPALLLTKHKQTATDDAGTDADDDDFH
jgi:hypothetical protein